MGGTRFGMRAAPKNFSDDELARAVSFAHENGVKVYLTCNIIPNTAQLKELPEFLEAASAAGVDALIITDVYKRQTVHGAQCAVTGYGRTAKVLADMLAALGAHVTVAARKCSDLAWARTGGLNACLLYTSRCV